MIYVLALLVSLAVVASLGVMLYVWFQLSLMRFHTAVARDVLTDWDAQARGIAGIRPRATARTTPGRGSGSHPGPAVAAVTAIPIQLADTA